MILLCGIPSEPPLRAVAEAAEAAGLGHVVVNQRASQHMEIRLALVDGSVSGRLDLGGRDIDLVAVTGALVRLMDAEALPENRPRPGLDPALVERSTAFHAVLSDWLELAGARVLNRPGATASNLSKPYQAQLIRAAGLAVPPTLVSNDPDEVRAFAAAHGTVVYKSVSSVRSIVRAVAADGLAGLDRLRALPTQFQAFIPGVNIRVHVVGEAVFATEIATEAVDYRYAEQDGLDLTMRGCALPDEVAERCRALSRRLDLPLCGIDLKRTPAGEHYCFEVNPAPAFTIYEDRTGQPIARAIAYFLAGAEPWCR